MTTQKQTVASLTVLVEQLTARVVALEATRSAPVTAKRDFTPKQPSRTPTADELGYADYQQRVKAAAIAQNKLLPVKSFVAWKEARDAAAAAKEVVTE